MLDGYCLMELQAHFLVGLVRLLFVEQVAQVVRALVEQVVMQVRLFLFEL
mgnify:CR=1 FL=1